MVIFLYNLDMFVWIQHSHLDNMVYTLDPSNRLVKKLWCTSVKGNGCTFRGVNSVKVVFVSFFFFLKMALL